MSATPPPAQELSLLVQYIRDLTVENPRPLRFLQAQEQEIDTQLEVDVQAQSIGDTEYEVTLVLKFAVKKGEETLYILELKFAGIFRITGMEEEMLKLILFTQCPHMLFPYARALVTHLTQESGLPPLNLQPIDFAALLQQRLRTEAS